jgi:hypothetical protein
MFFISMGSYSGHFKLDLSNHLDRLAAIRLAEVNGEERAVLRRAMPSWAKVKAHGYTSQNGDRNNFRNVTYKSMPIADGLTDDFFAR